MIVNDTSMIDGINITINIITTTTIITTTISNIIITTTTTTTTTNTTTASRTLTKLFSLPVMYPLQGRP